MSAWADGLLDNDSAQDAIRDLLGEVRERVIALADEPCAPGAARALAGGIGILLRHGGLPASQSPGLAAAIVRQRAALVALAQPAREIVEAVGSGRIDEARSADLDPLFATDEARAEVQRLVERAAELLDREMKPTDIRDLAAPLGALGLLLELGPEGLDPARVADWHRIARGAWQSLQSDDPEYDHYSRYIGNAEAAFDQLSR